MHSEYGKDEDRTQALLKKHEAVEVDIEGYKGRVEELGSESQGLLERIHFDSETIQQRQVSGCEVWGVWGVEWGVVWCASVCVRCGV